MSDKEFNAADRECEAITAANHRRHKVLGTTTEKSYSWAAVGRRVRRQAQMKRFGGTAARGAIGLTFLAAIPRGWMDPVFALLMAVACFSWMLYYLRRGYRYD